MNINKAVELLKKSKHTTAFTGAGISVESGIPTFRGEDGLWAKYDPVVLDLNYFHQNPKKSWTVIREIFYDFFGKATPNKAHQVLARMEQNKLLNSIITQNIDNLHQEAGSKTVYEFHGTAQNLICTQCNKKVHVTQVILNEIPVKCSSCKGLLKPDFIFFGEGIPQEAYQKSIIETELADVFLIIGTTGEIMPASQIPKYAKNNGAKIIEINPQKSNYTSQITDIHIVGKATEIMLEIEQKLFA